MENRKILRRQLFTDQTTPGFGGLVDDVLADFADYQIIMVSVVTSELTDGTLSFFSSLAAVTEERGTTASKVGFYNMDTGAFTAGATGLVLAPSTTYNLTLRTKLTHGIGVALDGITQGSVTAWLIAANDV